MNRRIAPMLLVVLAVGCGSKSVGEAPMNGGGHSGAAGSSGASAQGGAAGLVSLPAPDPQCDDCYVVNTSITAASPSDIFISGYQGLPGSFIRHFDGEHWETLHVWQDFGGLLDLWGSSTLGLYGLISDLDPVSMPGPVLYFDIVSGELTSLQGNGFALWGYAPDEVFAMDSSHVRKFNGSAWVDLGLSSNNLIDISGSSPEDVFVLRADGALHHYDGSVWTTRAGLDKDLKALWVSSSSEVYAIAGDDQPNGTTGPGLIAQHDGSAWTVVQDAPDDALLAVTGRPGRVYVCGANRGEGGEARAVVWRGEEGSWKRFLLEDVRAFLWDADCAPTGECYAVGTDNTVLALDELR